MKAPGRSAAGFTLTEMVVSITLAGILGTVVAVPLVEATRARRRTTARLLLADVGRTALERFSRELRMAPASTADDDAPDLALAAADRLDFGSTAYRLAGGTLERSQDGGATWRRLAAGVAAFSLGYADQEGAALSPLPLDDTARARVRRVTVTLTLGSDAESLTLRTGIYLRAFAYRRLR